MVFAKHFAVVAAAIIVFSGASQAQSSPNCPFLGPVFPAPQNVLQKPTSVPSALGNLTIAIQQLLDEDTVNAANVSFYLNVFTKDDSVFSFNHSAPNLKDSLTSGTLDEDTVFRIGSVSKLLTVYALLSEVGMGHMNDPVTTWVPELAKLAKQKGTLAPVENVNWGQVTLGALASQMAGISRDLSFSDLAYLNLVPNTTWPKDNAVPPIAKNELPTCGTMIGLPECSRKVFFQQLQSLHPITSALNTPIYSNIAFQILAYALEGITHKSFSDIFNSTLLGPLGLTRTSLEAPSSKDNAIIPTDELYSWWSGKTGDASPYGGMFSTISDLRTIGQSILNDTLLSPSLRKQWLKPVTHTADLKMSVGLPWEIHRMLLPLTPGSNNTRVVDLYTKNGALGLYDAMFVLSPDHEMGFVLLLASPFGAEEAVARNVALALLSEVAVQIAVPAFENAAREQAAARFSGTFANEDTNMTLTLGVEDGLPGLGVSNWTMGGQDILQLYAQWSSVPLDVEASLRLYPMDLEGKCEVALRGVYEQKLSSAAAQQGVFTSGCLAWGGADAVQYGNIGFDDFVIEVDKQGQAVAITPRVARQKLPKI
ncbi:hypothetical protein G7046_g9019 [Stylonectria norvegica]|nr:hypothetical protein G7046_g9019 [Stylonectria norvegica]